MRELLLCISLFWSLFASAQSHKLSGKITNRSLEPLALVTVQIRDMKEGTTSNEDGRYTLELEEGKYEIVFTMIGYKPRIVTVVIDKSDEILNMIMEEEGSSMTEVIVRGKARDRSEEFVRNVIRHKEELMAAPGPYSCEVYIRAIQEDSSMKAPKLRKNDTLPRPDLQYARMAMAEVALRLDHLNPRMIKEERTGIKKRGDPQSLFFLSTTEGNFDVYQNLIRVPGLSSVPFLSPVSYSGLVAYKYKLQKTTVENNRKIYTIAVSSKQVSNATVEGELVIEDSSWVVRNCTLRFPSYHMPEYDFFEVRQYYEAVEPGVWMITRQIFTYFSRNNRSSKNGQTRVSYHDFKLHQTFQPRDFTTEVSSTSQKAYDQDSSFWNHTRTEPLTDKEIRFIQFKDSIYRATHTKAYLDSIDRQVNKVTWKKLVFTGQTFQDHEKERRWMLPPIPALYQPFQFGGARIGASVFYGRVFPSRKTLNLFTDLSYGIRNHDLNGGLRIFRLYNPFNRGFYGVYVRRSFEPIFSGDAWINMLKRSNVYLNNSVGVEHGRELFNGFRVSTYADLAVRRSVSTYKINSKVDSLFGGFLDDNQPIAFEGYNAFYGKVRVEYTPFQKYIREPREKVILGSSWPTAYVSLRKGIPGVFHSTIDFTYLETGLEQSVTLGLFGTSSYSLKSGSFLSRKDLRLVDYQFQRRGDPLLFMNPQEAFQALDSSFPLFRRFYQLHYIHEFNGALLNRIPIFKKLRLKEIAGGGFLFAPERDLRYAELFTGVERVFKWPFNPDSKFKIGAYVVGSAANHFRNPVQFKVGITSWDRRRNKWY